MPRNRFLRRTFNDSIPKDATERLWTDSNQDAIISKEKPDVIVCVKPATGKWTKDHGIPVAVDFHGPDLIEFEQMAKYFLPTARYTLATRKLQSIALGDFFTCAGRRQRYYFLAFLMMAGVEISDLEVHYMPVAMSPDLPEHSPDVQRKSIIFSGGFYPWLNPMDGLRSLASILERNGGGHLDIFGGSHETNPDDSQEFEAFRSDLERNPQVTFHGYVPREEVIEKYRTGYTAFELMPRNAERDMAFTTRTVEFLWAGLPVIYNDYAELSEMIKQYQAGWLVPASDSRALSEVVNRILDEPLEVARASENAQTLVRENLVYDRVIKPLADFCRNPRIRKRSQDSDYLMIPSPKKGFGYIDHLYVHYRRLPFKEFVKAVATAGYVLVKNKVQNL
jgi:glycosyltransferase involved in cell wall biosynthesis